MKRIRNLLLTLALVCASLGYADTISFPHKVQISSPIIITNSNTTLHGDDTVIFLETNSNCPVILIGNASGEPITNIEVYGISIDGNRDGQTKERWKSLTNGVINNNGIIVQNAHDVRIHDVSINNCRSGGLVTTFHVDNLSVSNLSAGNNEFDGVACYETTNSTFSHLVLHDNQAAGISLDNHFNNNVFSNVTISNNMVGIFMRNSNGNRFTDVTVQHCPIKLFMSHVNTNLSSGCSDNVFERITGIGGVSVNSQTCTNNVFRF